MKNKQIYKWIILFVLMMSLLLVGMVVKEVTSTNIKENNIIVKENVKIIEDILPLEVTEKELVFSSDPELLEGDIVVAGVIESAPSGFIRKILSVKENDNKYYVNTESANLTDVFEELHMTKSFELKEDGAEEIILNGNNEESLLFTYSTINAGAKIKNINHIQVDTDNKKQQFQFDQKFSHELAKGINVEGGIGFNVCLELTLDISDGDIIFGVATGTEINGNLITDIEGDGKLVFEKELMSRTLPNLQFQAGIVPIVVTNQINSSIEGEMSAQGDLQTTFEIEGQNVAGFEYNSRNKGVKELNDSNLSTDGIKCTTKEKIAGEVSVGLYVHLVSKLYGSTGFDLSMGGAGDISCEMIVIEEKKSDNQYIGYTDLAIVPKLKGNIVVTIPIIDVDLVEAPIFNVELKPLWEKNWKSSSDWKTLIDENTKIELSNTYLTQYSSVNMVDYSSFTLDYPDNWSLVKIDVNSDGENFKLINDRGVEIEYLHRTDIAKDFFLYGGRRYSVHRYEVSKVSDASLDLGKYYVPDAEQPVYESELGEFIVAQLELTGELDMDTDEDYTVRDDGITYYVLIEDYRIGTDEMITHDIQDAYTWWWGAHISIVASAPDGKFTQQEKKEIIEILGSFR